MKKSIVSEVALRAHSIRLVSGLDRNAPKATVANRTRIIGENSRNVRRLMNGEIHPTVHA